MNYGTMAENPIWIIWKCGMHIAFCKIPDPCKSKFGPRGMKSVFVGMLKIQKYIGC